MRKQVFILLWALFHMIAVYCYASTYDYNKCGIQKVTEAILRGEEVTRPTPGPHNVHSTHFLVHYFTEGQHVTTRVYAESVSKYAEYCWAKQVDTLGWAAPPSDDNRGGDERYDIYIRNIEDEYLGLTDPEFTFPAPPGPPYYPDGRPSFTRIKNINRPNPWNILRVTVAHEFNHACQFRYSYLEEVWWRENTATWMEDICYDDIDDYLGAFENSPDPLDSTHWAITDTTRYYENAGGIWVMFLHEYYNIGCPRRCWERMGQEPEHTITGIAGTLRDVYQSDLCTALKKYAVWRYFTGPDRFDNLYHFSESNLWPESRILRPHNAYPASGNQGNQAPQSPGGTNFIQFTSGTDFLNITFDEQTAYHCGVFAIGYRVPEQSIEKEISLDNSYKGTTYIPWEGSNHIVLIPVTMLGGTPIEYEYQATCDKYTTNWINRYNGPGNSDDRANSLAYGTDGNIYAGGQSRGSGTNDFTVISLNPIGSERWVYRKTNGMAYSLVYGTDDNIYAGGGAPGISSPSDLTVISLTPTGNESWVYQYNGQANRSDVSYSLVYGADGNIYTAGYCFNIPYDPTADLAVISLTPTGAERWVYLYNGPGDRDDWANSLAYGTDGSIYVAGFSGYVQASIYDFTVISLTSSGAENWVYRNPYGGAYSLVYGADGNIYAAGYSTGSGINDDFTVISLTSSGTQRWIYRYNGPGNSDDRANSLAYGTDGNIYIAGYSTGSGTNDDFTVISLTSSGTQRWVYRYNGPGNGDDRANSLAYGTDGNIYAAGNSVDNGPGSDFTVISLTPIPPPPQPQIWTYSRNFNLRLPVNQTKDTILTIRNNGNDALSWNLSESPTVDWLSAYPTSGEINPGQEARIGISFNTSGLSQGFYPTNLVITSNDQNSPTVIVPVEISVFVPVLDVSVTEIVSPPPVIEEGKTVTPTCKVYNYGTESARYTVRMKIGFYYDEIAWVDEHLPSTKIYVTFPEWTASSFGGMYTFAACSTQLVGDEYPVNDKKIIRVWVIPIAVPYDMATYPNQGTLLAVDANNGKIHLVYNSGSTVNYAVSEDTESIWKISEIDSGSCPSIALDSFGLTRISYVKNDTVFCKILKPDSTWKTVVIFGYNQSWKPKEPAIAPSYPPELANYSYSTFSTKDPMSNSSKINLSFFDINSDVAPPPNEVTSGESLNSPAIAITPGDYLHITWEDNGEIFYRTSLQPIDPAQPIEWSDIHNVSESPEVISEHPVIEAYGENIIIAWKEGAPGEIYRRIRNINSDVADWSEIENISQSPTQESDYPVLSTPDVVAWQEQVDSVNYEIYAWVQGDIVNLSETENASRYPHIVVEPQEFNVDSLNPEIVINTIWTEAVIPDSLYEVRFKRYEHRQGDVASSGAIEYISVSVGDSLPSPYCQQRDGYIHYEEYKIDYSRSSLLYHLPYLKPKASYLIRALVYQGEKGRWRERMYIDDTLAADVYYDPKIPRMVNIILPNGSYGNDLEIRKEIKKVLGRVAVVANMKVYEVNLPDSTGGKEGALGNREDLKCFALYQNQPNPFKDLTKIAFTLPRECKVSLFVYNVTGRRVRTLIDEKMKPGNYNLKWNGKDNHNRNLAQGIYFYRLQTEDFKDTKKTILLK